MHSIMRLGSSGFSEKSTFVLKEAALVCLLGNVALGWIGVGTANDSAADLGPKAAGAHLVVSATGTNFPIQTGERQLLATVPRHLRQLATAEALKGVSEGDLLFGRASGELPTLRRCYRLHASPLSAPRSAHPAVTFAQGASTIHFDGRLLPFRHGERALIQPWPALRPPVCAQDVQLC